MPSKGGWFHPGTGKWNITHWGDSRLLSGGMINRQEGVSLSSEITLTGMNQLNHYKEYVY